MSKEQIKDMILKQCLELTTNNDFRPPISAYDGIDIDDVVRTCKQLQDKKTYLDLVKENQELKKQVEKVLNDYCRLDAYNKNQQKEFIKYLEDEIKQINPKILDDGELNLRLDDIKYTQYLTYKEILQKYKSIIGDDKE